MDYTNLYNFRTDNGIIVPSDKDVLLGIQQKFQEIFGADIDLSAETPVGRLIEAFAVMVKSALGVTAQTANQFNVNEATGIYLDALAQMFDLRRIAETRTQIRIRCYFAENQAGTSTIPAGSLIMAASTGAIFMVDEAIENNGTNRDTTTGRIYADGTATATEGGAIVVPNGVVNTIQTMVMGWTGVTNLETIHTGTELESDAALRRRINETRFVGGGFYEGLLSALKRLSGVKSACLLENNTGTEMIKKGVLIPPHSIYVCIDCIDTTSLIPQIANAIAKSKPVGVGMVNSDVPKGTLVSQNVNYGYDNGSVQTIYFYKPQRTAVRCNINFTASNYSTLDIAKQIISAAVEYMDSVGVGGTASGMSLSNHLTSKLGIMVNSVWLQKDGADTTADISVEMMGYEVPYTSTAYINLTQKMT